MSHFSLNLFNFTFVFRIVLFFCCWTQYANDDDDDDDDVIDNINLICLRAIDCITWTRQERERERERETISQNYPPKRQKIIEKKIEKKFNYHKAKFKLKLLQCLFECQRFLLFCDL